MAVNLTSTKFTNIQAFRGTRSQMSTCAFPGSTGSTDGTAIPRTYGQGMTIQKVIPSIYAQGITGSGQINVEACGLTGSGSKLLLGTPSQINYTPTSLNSLYVSPLIGSPLPQDCWLQLNLVSTTLTTNLSSSYTYPINVLVDYTDIVFN